MNKKFNYTLLIKKIYINPYIEIKNFETNI